MKQESRGALKIDDMKVSKAGEIFDM